jgi:hypothetical protein
MGNLDAASFEPRSFTHRTDRGELRLSTPGPTIFLFEYQGFSDASFIPFIEKIWDESFPAPELPIQLFADTELQTGYTTEFRTGLMPWTKRAIGLTDTYMMLVKSRWVAMGIAIGRAMLGAKARHVEVTTDRNLFRSRLEAAVQRSLGMPPREHRLEQSPSVRR